MIELDATGGGPSPGRPLHPRRGVHDARTTSPPRRPGQVRRTSSVDATRPEGLDGPLVLLAAGRDLLTPAAGPAQVLDEASMSATVDYLTEKELRQIAVDPPLDLRGLVGASAASGFRRRLDGVVPDLVGGGSIAYWLLDEIPVATLVSGFALSHAGFVHPYTGRRSARPDQCAGWVTGGSIMVEIERSGRSPLPTGPVAPVLEPDDDPLAWHAMADLPAGAVRRRRLVDVTLEDGLAVADVLFRDSHMDDDGLETVVHEYGVTAMVDPATWVVRETRAVAEVMPWVECSSAVGSAERLPGTDVRTLRSWVREELTGTSTCTHLNDTLRGLADLPRLVAPLQTERSEP